MLSLLKRSIQSRPENCLNKQTRTRTTFQLQTMNTQTILFLLVASLLMVKCEHLILGDANKKQLIYHTKVEYAAVPFMKRVKEVFYSSPEQRIISVSRYYYLKLRHQNLKWSKHLECILLDITYFILHHRTYKNLKIFY